jgi:hypothetical protein
VSSPSSQSFRGLRLQLYIVVALLAIEIVLGVAVTLFAKLPASDKGTSLFTAFGGAIASGPANLTIHAIVGTLLVLAGISVIIRAARSRTALQIVLSIIGMVGLLGAWTAGTGFVGHQVDGASFGMALSAGIALLAYVTALFTVAASGPDVNAAASR